MATPLGLLFMVLLGAAVGSFINVVVYRLPQGRSLLWPPSACPRCLSSLAWYDNIPIFGWLMLRGRCRYCHRPIAPRYPMVELTTAVLFALVAWRFEQPLLVLGYCGLVSWLLALSLIDLDTMRLPNALTQSGLVLGLLFRAGLGWAGGAAGGSAAGGDALVGGVLGMVLGLWLFEGISLLGSLALGQTAMGGGDAKLAAMLGAWLGWPLLLLTTVLACLLGAATGLAGRASGRMGRRQAMPFGPFLAMGGTIALFTGARLISLYLTWFWPS